MTHKLLSNIKKICCCLLVTVPIASWGVHPADGMGEMDHPSEPVPEDALVPSILFDVLPDMMDGYNLLLDVQKFNLVAPTMAVMKMDNRDEGEREESNLLQGHAHLYVNNEKVMRVYGKAFHLPSEFLKEGVNSITISINNHVHGAYTFEEKEIQSTVIIDTRANTEDLVKSIYSWPLSL